MLRTASAVVVVTRALTALCPFDLSILSSLLWAGQQSPRGWKAEPNTIYKQNPNRFYN